MLNWKKIVVGVLALCMVPGYLCAQKQRCSTEEKMLQQITYYLNHNKTQELKTYLDKMLNSEVNPYRVLDDALKRQYTNKFGKTPFEFNYEHYREFYNTYKDTWLKSEVEYLMMGRDSNGWLKHYFHPDTDGSKYLDLGEGLYIRAYLKKYLGIDTKGMLLEHAARYPNLVYFDLCAWQLKAILLGAETMAADLGDRALYLQVKHNIFSNYLDYDTYEREGLTKEFVRTLKLLGAENDKVWKILKIKPITKKMKENAVKLYSKCHGTVGLNKKLCENFQKHAKEHGVWMKIKVPPLPTPERRTTSIL